MSTPALVRRSLRRPPWWLVGVTALALAAVVALLAWPSSGGGAPSTDFRVAEVAPAVRAVEGRLGGPQTYTEIKVSAQGVSLFVADGSGRDVPWFYRAGDLQGPAPAQEAGAFAPFPLDGVALDKAPSVARRALAQFPTATLEEFSLLRLPDAGVVWSLALRSAKGGRIDVTFTPAGELRGAELR